MARRKQLQLPGLVRVVRAKPALRAGRDMWASGRVLLTDVYSHTSYGAFWLNHDPTTLDRQFCDSGSQYRPGIYWHSEEQRKQAEASKAKYEKLKTFKQPIVTPIVKASQFYPAEDYHQDYYTKNPTRYKFYRNGCGRDARLRSLWGDKAG